MSKAIQCPQCGIFTSRTYKVSWYINDEIHEVEGVVACSAPHAISSCGVVSPDMWATMQDFSKFDGNEYSLNTVTATFMDILQEELYEETREEDKNRVREAGNSPGGQGLGSEASSEEGQPWEETDGEGDKTTNEPEGIEHLQEIGGIVNEDEVLSQTAGDTQVHPGDGHGEETPRPWITKL